MAFILTKMNSDGVPPGLYTGEFADVKEMTNDHGDGYQWLFTITDGTFKGQTASRFTDRIPKSTNACGRMLDALVGKVIEKGEDIDISLYIGHKYTIIVGTAKNGGTRVETIVKA